MLSRILVKDNDSMVQKCQTFTVSYLINFPEHFALVFRNSVYKMEKSCRELIRTRNQDSRFVTKITMQL